LVTTQGEQKFDWVTFLFIAGIHLAAVVGFVSGVLGYIPNFFGLDNILVFFVMYYITGCLGITLGYHRLFTHRSFETKPWIQFILGICGLLALQSDPVSWSADHRIHHIFSDKDGDKHDSSKGFFWSHMKWLFFETPVSQREHKIRETLMKNKVLKFLNSKTLMIVLQIVLGTSLYLFGGWGMMIWGVLIRAVCVWNVTWLINSASHMWGYRWFKTEDNSVNNWLTAILAFGEGWHNTHHAHESSPKHGIAWWEIDVTWMHIWVLQKLGLAWNLKPIPEKPKI
jgi:sn-1 stearoyl-lipid 9-desaturase